MGMPSVACGPARMLPALFAIFGNAAFWPSAVRSRRSGEGAWGRIARRVVERPAPVLLAAEPVIPAPFDV